MGRRASGAAQGKNDTGPTSFNRKMHVDMVKHDGVLKEMVKRQYDLSEAWSSRWEFLANSRQHWEREAANQGFDYQGSLAVSAAAPVGPSTSAAHTKHQLPSEPTAIQPPPRISSNMIGWRPHKVTHNMDLLAGPLYTSPKLTMEPPVQPDECDTRLHQNCIFLG